jgi:hypothetical protein
MKNGEAVRGLVRAALFCLVVYYGKCRAACFVVSGVNEYAVFGTVVMIAGFLRGFAVVKYPADFVFPLFRDKGGIFEDP